MHILLIAYIHILVLYTRYIYMRRENEGISHAQTEGGSATVKQLKR